MIPYSKWLNKRILVLFTLTLVVSCSTNSNSDDITDPQDKIQSSNVSWAKPESLIDPIKMALSQSCAYFPLQTAKIEFLQDHANYNFRTIEVDEATLLVYLDGAIEPDIEDEASTVIFYDDWGCASDTLFIEDLRFSNTDFYGAENEATIFNCVDEYENQPRNLIITCADANMGIENISWKSWNTVEASGEGVFYENNCSPDCATGSLIRQEAEIQLSNIQRDKNGKSVFTEIIVQTREKQQAGGYMDTYSLYFDK